MKKFKTFEVPLPTIESILIRAMKESCPPGVEPCCYGTLCKCVRPKYNSYVCPCHRKDS